ncbi:MAG: Flp family type IVb pilin [Clostridiales bacterium]|nr:Flp family type IVb pilin [Clostridiales bacterium]
MKKFLAWLKNEESGQGMVEYGLIVALIVVVIVAVIFAFGDKIKELFGGIETKMDEGLNKIEGAGE